MCMIVGEDVQIKIADTSIYARISSKDTQVVVYSMLCFTDKPAALVLPIPVTQNSGDDALRFIDLSKYADFFDDMNDACSPLVADFECGSEDDEANLSMDKPPLIVHCVGDFEASYVPHKKDFSRLDKRFQLDDAVWDALPIYDDYGFAVFQLSPSNAKDIYENGKKVHPMAFEFKTRDATRCFYPTIHVHDRQFHSSAMFDHTLYCQLPGDDMTAINQLALNFEDGEDHMLELGFVSPNIGQSFENASAYMDIEKTKNIVDPTLRLYSYEVRGYFENKDHWL